MLTINTNLSSLITQHSMKQSTNKLNQAIERMTTGYKINHSKDNAANYSITTNMTTKIGAYKVAEENVAMGIDLVTTASDSISLMENHAERLRALCIQSRNGTYGAESLAAITAESNSIIEEINRVYSTTTYNGISLFDSENSSNPNSSTGLRDVSNFVSISTVDEATGFTESEYKIETVDDLVKLANLTNAGVDTTGITFVLANDIDIGAYCDEELANGNGGWTPIGNISSFFLGTFDGNGFVIKNLKIDRNESYQGLFGLVAGGEIKNLGVVDGNVVISLDESASMGLGVGALAGAILQATITNCYTNCDVTVPGNIAAIGGLVGESYYDSTIRNCYATGDVNGINSIGVGGLLGADETREASLTNCYATGNVSGNSCVGGLTGYCKLITNCYETGNVSGVEGVGGLVGSVNNGTTTITNSYATGTVDGSIDVGGFRGGTTADSTYINCASVQGDLYVPTMTKEEIKSTYTPEMMGFTEENGWKIVNGTPHLAWESSKQASGGSSGACSLALQVGVNGNSSSQIGLEISLSYDLSAVLADITSDDSLKAIDNFVAQLSEESTNLGAVQNRLESALDEISTQYENLVSSRSTLRDADIAEVSSEYIKQQILQQASATLMATANQSPAIALQLI